MSDYVKSTNFASKDALSTGNPLKIVKGTEIDTEFNNIATAVATKAPLNSPTFIGTPAAPTASTGTNTTQLATTAFVKTAVDNYDAALTVSTAQIEDAAVTTAKIADANVTSAKLANGAATGAKLGSDVVVTSGDQTIGGTKTFTNGVRFNDGTTQTTAAIAPTTANVLTATAGASADAVGSYAFLSRVTTAGNLGGLAAGGTVAGSVMRFASSQIAVSGTPSGTWRCMGFMSAAFDGDNNVTNFYPTVFLRIS